MRFEMFLVDVLVTVAVTAALYAAWTGADLQYMMWMGFGIIVVILVAIIYIPWRLLSLLGDLLQRWQS